jgi:predicted CxxxxCH...CXXCH cytochrome family protein
MANLGGAHAKHAGRIALASTTRTYANYTANVSDGIDGAGGSYGFGCTTCHPSAVSNHINGSIEVTFAADAAAGSMRSKIATSATTYSLTANLQGDKTCANVYCHSTGIGSVANTTVSWTSTFTAAERCAKCHGNLPTTGAHGAHKVGIHYDNIFSGTSGFLGYSSSGNKAHGVSTQSTTISCNVCHAATVNTAYNKFGSVCNSCHSADPDVALLDATNGYKFHVNGKVDVAFPNTSMRSKAQIRDTSFDVYSGLWVRTGGYKVGAGSYDIAKKALNTSVFTASGTQGQGSCANVVCHNQRTGDSVTWNQTLTCVDCHSQL